MKEWEYYVPSIVSNDQRIGMEIPALWKVFIQNVNGKRLKQPITLEQFLNTLGKQGWELVRMHNTNGVDSIIFKRPKQAE